MKEFMLRYNLKHSSEIKTIVLESRMDKKNLGRRRMAIIPA